jgi:Fe-Mn family superoxide dismutase
MSSDRAEDADLLLRRRELMAAAALAGVGALVPGCASTTQPATETQHALPSTAGATMAEPTALNGTNTVVPLPFAPASLKGLSERLITSHHENNYAGAVKNLNGVEKQLAQINKETPPFLVVALRERELTFRNSKTLHEAYFANLGGDGKRSGAIDTALSQAYGTGGRWEEQFRMTGMGLGGGSGWVILGYELLTGALRTFGSGNHTQAPATTLPLLVMDMYEHSYQMDYGAQHPQYIDAFFANIKWDEVNRRLEVAQRAAGTLRGETKASKAG